MSILMDIEEPESLLNLRTEKPNATWRELKSNPDVNLDLKRSVIRKTGGLCVYCEQKLVEKTDYQIEHFHPKNGNENADYGDGIPNMAIAWSNLFPCCLGGTAIADNFESQYDVDFRTGANGRNKDKLTCGQKKGNRDPEGVFIPPWDIRRKPSLFKYDFSNGSISVNDEICNRYEIDPRLAMSHLIGLNLDSVRLRGARMNFEQSINKQVREFPDDDLESVAGYLSSLLSLNDSHLYSIPFVSLFLCRYGELIE
ncbi:hypothetical protein [Plesiomonas shigelloides]|uniref:hypothetical protein n=1 Tax=Plesiomonas shigelloides TaxID=703 RepID=UPI00057AB12C|nr:hypothetical protein [Plesiomonas shigelloides]